MADMVLFVVFTKRVDKVFCRNPVLGEVGFGSVIGKTFILASSFLFGQS